MSEQTTLKVGDRVELLHTWTGWKFSKYEAGSRGTVTAVFGDYIAVQLDDRQYKSVVFKPSEVREVTSEQPAN